MNNFKKIGLTALAGSLVTLGSAVAGEMSVSGGINTTLKFGKGGGNTGRSIGTDKDVSFSGGGELDNGTTFSMSTTLYDNYEIRADSIQVMVFEKSCVQNDCKTKKIKSKLESELKLAILKKAALFEKDDFKKYKETEGKFRGKGLIKNK